MKTTKITEQTIKKLAKLMAENATETIEIGVIGDKKIEIEVKKYLTASEFCTFVKNMTDAEWFLDEETGKELYKPAYSVLVFDAQLISFYTNVNLISDANEVYDIITPSELAEKVLGVVGYSEQFYKLTDAIKKAQEHYYKQKTGLSGLLSTLKETAGSFDINKTTEAIQQFSPEQLQHFSELKELAKRFTNPKSEVSE